MDLFQVPGFLEKEMRSFVVGSNPFFCPYEFLFPYFYCMNYLDTPDHLAALLRVLPPDQPPVFGTLTPQHMVEHLSFVLGFSNGLRSAQLTVSPEKSAVFKAKFILGPDPFPKGVQLERGNTALPSLVYGNPEDAIEALLQAIADFHRYFNEFPDAKPVHPFFGPMSKDEWRTSHHKHITHHLQQFNLIP